MPRKVTAYACKFFCGRKTDTNRKRMEAHEQRCRLNPARRACPTCKNWEEEISDEYSGHQFGEPTFRWVMIRFCKIDINKDPNGENRTPFIYDCEKWEPRAD